MTAPRPSHADRNTVINKFSPGVSLLNPTLSGVLLVCGGSGQSARPHAAHITYEGTTL
jgi:hypothetical protein